MNLWAGHQMLAVNLTQEEHTTSMLQSSQAECYLEADMQRLRSKTRDKVIMRTERWSQCHPRGETSGR